MSTTKELEATQRTAGRHRSLRRLLIGLAAVGVGVGATITASASGPSSEDEARARRADAQLEQQFEDGWVPYEPATVLGGSLSPDDAWVAVASDGRPVVAEGGRTEVRDQPNGEVIGYIITGSGYVDLAHADVSEEAVAAETAQDRIDRH